VTTIADRGLEQLRNFVNGEQVDAASGRTSEVADPSTGEAYAQAPVSGPADADAALRAAATAFEGWRDSTPAERSLALLRMADAVQARARDIVAAECRNTGKPVGITMAEEIPPLVDELRFFAGAARILQGTAALQALRVRQGPVGVRLRGLHPHQARDELPG
jgi:betaine-aldehyde dehydrogenase